MVVGGFFSPPPCVCVKNVNKWLCPCFVCVCVCAMKDDTDDGWHSRCCRFLFSGVLKPLAGRHFLFFFWCSDINLSNVKNVFKLYIFFFKERGYVLLLYIFFFYLLRVFKCLVSPEQKKKGKKINKFCVSLVQAWFPSWWKKKRQHVRAAILFS